MLNLKISLCFRRVLHGHCYLQSIKGSFHGGGGEGRHPPLFYLKHLKLMLRYVYLKEKLGTRHSTHRISEKSKVPDTL